MKLNIIEPVDERITKKDISILFGILLLACVFLFYSYFKQNSKINELKSDIAALEQKTEKLSEQIGSLEIDMDDLSADIYDLSEDISNTNSNIDEAWDAIYDIGY